MTKPRAKVNADYYSNRTADIIRKYCDRCGVTLRSDSPRCICAKCFRKSDEGREYMRIKKAESRKAK